MKKALYLLKHKFPWDPRAEKICVTLQNNGFEILLASLWKNENEEQIVHQNFKIVRLGYEKNAKLFLPIPYNPFWTQEISRIVNEFRPELIIVREFHLVGNVRKVVADRIPIVLDMAEHYPAAYKIWERYQKNFILRFTFQQLKLADAFEKDSVRKSDGIIVVCNEQKERLVTQYHCKPENICVVHNTPAINQEDLKPRKFSSEPNRFVHHGYISSEKDISEFLKLFLRAFANNPQKEFHIVGEGETLPKLKQIVNNARSKSKVFFYGLIPYNQLFEIISKAEVGIVTLPTNDFNNFTLHNKIFEYFSVGLPVIGSTVKPIKRIIEETRAGLSVDLSKPEEVISILQNLSNFDWEAMSRNAVEYASKKYNWTVDAENLVKFINKFC